ncbi:peroxisome biogenesis factor 10-like [Anopheles albimanus]|uniref:RING-type E3 ubiquitin transferase n=1 Tax=Anopheles albimanus TaxID=7167 RepID=A0A182FK46_ANOAL|nr:peroxisome biogenesis factor 10-like [Anopheles albimanus]
MSLFHANAGRAEIIRSVQKDQLHIEEIRTSLSDLLLVLSQRHWYRYNALCKTIAEILYHHYAILNNLQTLGEEYTGIIQVDSNYVMLPNKMLQLLAILLEYGGEPVVYQLLAYLQQELERSDELLPSAKRGINKFIEFVRASVPFVRAFHTSLFYINGGKYHISKRLTGINYVLIRNWLKENHSILGYRILGYVTLAQLALTLAARYRQHRMDAQRAPKPTQDSATTTAKALGQTDNGDNSLGIPHSKCALCMDTLQDVSVAQCGHLFCWLCIFSWLDQRQVCPICRDTIKKSRIVRLQNF